MAISMVYELQRMLNHCVQYLRGSGCISYFIRAMVILLTVYSTAARAVSFTADVVQIKGDDLVHARVFWLDGRVRFEYLDQGVQMARIFDSKYHRAIWLDTENKVYVERVAKPTVAEQPQPVNKPADERPGSPCESYKLAQCTRLKSAEINHRDTDKWLITFNVNGRDEHMFQWIDKQYRIPLRQENPDGSILDASIVDDIEVDSRKAYKVEMLSIASDGSRASRIQWYDSELNVIVRQQDDNGTVEELRNIKLEPVSEDKFAIPDGYEAFKTRLSASDNGSSIIFSSQ